MSASAATSRIHHAFDFLVGEKDASPALGPCVVASGGDSLLQRLVLASLEERLAGGEFASRYDGDELEWRDLRDELHSASLFCEGPRLVTVRGADGFISRCRAELEAYVTNPAATATLLLATKSFPGNTRLAKLISEHGTQILCELPQRASGKRTVVDQPKLMAWIAAYAKSRHGLPIGRGEIERLVDAVGDNLELMDQELAKLAVFVDAGSPVRIEDIDAIVGGWRAKTTWDLMEAVADGKPAESLIQLHRLLQGGEVPQSIFGGLAWWFRRYAAAAQQVEAQERRGKPIPLDAALEGAGFRKFPPDALAQANRQIRRMGRQRVSRLFQDLAQIDLKLKGSHAAPERGRRLLETLIVDLATCDRHAR